MTGEAEGAEAPSAKQRGEARKAPRPAELRATLIWLSVSFGWVLLGSLSLLVGLVALLTTAALAHQAGPGRGGIWYWSLAALITFGLPLGIAIWKHHKDPHPSRSIPATMAWLPTVWNVLGLLLAIQLVPDVLGTSLRSCEWMVQGRFGDSHSVTRALSAFGHETADFVDPSGTVQPLDDDSYGPLPPAALEDAIAIPMPREGAAIFVDLELEGKGASATKRYLFDTGASYTTITTKTARELGIDVPRDAPSLEFNTARGLGESRMVYLPHLRLGGVELDGLLVSVCDSCATSQAAGLLGLNAIREFLVQMDYQGRRMELIPRLGEARSNRAYDIQPMVTMKIEGRPEIWLGRVRWVVLVENHSTEPIDDLVPRVEFRDGPTLLGERVERIEPGEIGRSLLVGKVEEGEGSGGKKSADSVEFTLSLSEAYW